MRPRLEWAVCNVRESSRDIHGSGHEERDQAIARQRLSLGLVAALEQESVGAPVADVVDKVHRVRGVNRRERAVELRSGRYDEDCRRGLQDVELIAAERWWRCPPQLRKSKAHPRPWCLSCAENRA